MQRFERRGACGESLAIARELEAWVDADAPNVGEVVDVQAREVTSLLRRAEGAERGQQLLVERRMLARGRRAQMLEAWPFGKKRAPDDTKCQARIATLQEPNGRAHSVHVKLGMLKKVSDRGRHRATLSGGPHALAENIGCARDERA